MGENYSFLKKQKQKNPTPQNQHLSRYAIFPHQKDCDCPVSIYDIACYLLAARGKKKNQTKP